MGTYSVLVGLLSVVSLTFSQGKTSFSVTTYYAYTYYAFITVCLNVIHFPFLFRMYRGA